MRPNLRLNHRRQSGPGAEESTIQVGVQHIRPIRIGHLAQRPVAVDPYIVHQNVDLTEFVQGRGQHPLGVIFGGDIALDQ